MAIRALNAIQFLTSCSSCQTKRCCISAHDYKGDTVSTIGEEKLFNPRLKVKSVDEYVDLMNNLKLPNPKMMDVAVPANIHVGLHQDEIRRKGWAVSGAEALALRGRSDI